MPRKPPLTPEQTEQAVKLLRAGYTLEYIAATVGATYNKTRNALMLELGHEYLAIIEANTACVAITQDAVNEMAELYRTRQYTQMQLACMYRVNLATVSNQLRRVMPDYSDITLALRKAQANRSLKVNWQQVYDTLYCDQQLDYAQIGKRLNCQAATVRKHLERIREANNV